jgi:hypothetical protein
VELIDGITLSGTVEVDKYRYYKFMAQSTSDLVITAIPEYGDVDLFVGFGDA